MASGTWQVRRALARAGAGRSLSVDEAAALLGARGPELAELCAVAAALRDAGLRDAGRAGIITYSPKVFIPLTRLCRDRCHYCTFATDPADLRRRGQQAYLSQSEVLAIARAGADAGCTEALFTLGDRPEHRWPAAREWLTDNGFTSTLEYLRHAAAAVLAQTGLLPHLNPGVLTWEELVGLRPVAVSMGLMMEQTATRLFTQPGQVHHGSPDKDPAVRLAMLRDAGRASIPFTTGILVGIGETHEERITSLLDIRRIHREYGHVQEVIVQNFRAKPATVMAGVPDAGADDLRATIAVTRLLLGPTMRVQVPPNLSDPAALPGLLAAGADDWGGVSPVTADHVNPERPWPAITVLTHATEEAGMVLQPRLAIHERYLARCEQWCDPAVVPAVNRLRRQASPAVAGGPPDGVPGVHGDWTAVRADAARIERTANIRIGLLVPGDLERALHRAAADPASLADPRHEQQAIALASAVGTGLAEAAAIADDWRRRQVGEMVTYVVNRNINFTNICYTGCRFCAFGQRAGDPEARTLDDAQIAEKVAEARALGATEICMQGGIDPALPADAYPRLARLVKSSAPGIHLHAFSPMEVRNGVARSGLALADWLTMIREAGVDSLPGTAAEILDDEVRWVLTRGKLSAASWIEVIETAHRMGLPTTATMMYGHVDRPIHWVGHLRVIRAIAERTGGFTEFVPLPFIPHNAPLYRVGIARPGPTPEQSRAVHVLARLLLVGAVDNLQVSWVKCTDEQCIELLGSGVNDLGGTLMEESISAMAGSSNGSSRSPADLRALAAAAGRPVRQRTTTYGAVARVSA
ncbi:MAG: 5-amino-6-(D-ribitylamino)uracil--L-tyrosine 4-hydroxyphenyl transferase CofH [Actinomycetales bacterium]|nr:5-amino-6-(D-ribitylamino)uracil--L-tyrosine 4-hydroxyphenyl transferase CofH [Actinomycetales bacterium]